MTRTTSCARRPCRCRGVSRCRGRRGWRAAAAPSCRSWTWMRWEIRSDDHRRRRPTRHLQGGRPGPGLQHLPGRADPPVRSPRAAPQGTRFSRGCAALSGRGRAARGSSQAAQRARAAPRGDAYGDPRVGGRQARRHRRRGHRGAPCRGPRDHVAASTTEAAAPECTGTRPVVHADHIGASTFIEKGWSLISLGDYAGAIQALQKALQLSPGETQAESLLGWAQMLHEDYDDALGTFQKVLMEEPANSLARINVGYICLKKRIFGEAIEH